MRFLRTSSTRRLLVMLAAAAVVAACGAAIALAAGGGGPKPPSKPLAAAVHDAIGGPDPSGVSARVKFTNHLIDSASLEGSAPLLRGGSGRLWLTKGHLRLELQSEQGDAQIVADDKRFWVYEVSSNTVYSGAVPQDRKAEKGGARERRGAPSLKEIEDAIARLSKRADVSGAAPTNIAGQPAYSVRVAPHDGGLVGAGRLGFDAARGVPLRVGLYARGSDSPTLELAVSDISYGPVPAGTFSVTPPKGAKVVDVAPPRGKAKEQGARREVSGRAAVAKAVPFKLAAPSTLAGRKLEGVHAIDWKGGSGAVATYGRGLGGIAVIERPAERSADTHRGGEHGGNNLSLPRVRVGGTSAEELATPLGTMIRFDRGGVSYTLVGSVTRATAEAAARDIAP
jgi:outer membrane lipoprotein-sorting protein